MKRKILAFLRWLSDVYISFGYCVFILWIGAGMRSSPFGDTEETLFKKVVFVLIVPAGTMILYRFVKGRNHEGWLSFLLFFFFGITIVVSNLKEVLLNAIFWASLLDFVVKITIVELRKRRHVMS